MDSFFILDERSVLKDFEIPAPIPKLSKEQMLEDLKALFQSSPNETFDSILSNEINDKTEWPPKEFEVWINEGLDLPDDKSGEAYSKELEKYPKIVEQTTNSFVYNFATEEKWTNISERFDILATDLNNLQSKVEQTLQTLDQDPQIFQKLDIARQLLHQKTTDVDNSFQKYQNVVN